MSLCVAPDYNIVGHSGAGPEHIFVPFGKPPNTLQERAQVVQNVFVATNCPSGDHTLAGAEIAIERVVEKPADDYFVFLLSDANLGQYGVSARTLSQAMQINPKVTNSLQPLSAVTCISGEYLRNLYIE